MYSLRSDFKPLTNKGSFQTNSKLNFKNCRSKLSASYCLFDYFKLSSIDYFNTACNLSSSPFFFDFLVCQNVRLNINNISCSDFYKIRPRRSATSSLVRSYNLESPRCKIMFIICSISFKNLVWPCNTAYFISFKI